VRSISGLAGFFGQRFTKPAAERRLHEPLRRGGAGLRGIKCGERPLIRV
jgi:hypothetical protein